MLKQTRLATLVFGVFRPGACRRSCWPSLPCWWQQCPPFRASGGIFVIAAGAVIYSELRAAGAGATALAAAMSGSLGVVLRLLLVVVIAYLNRVTTDELFGWGIWVFVLTATMFSLVAVTVNRQSSSTWPR